jgi:hypothetical protein
MTMSMQGVLAPKVRQQIHRALWSLYVRLEDDMPEGPPSLGAALKDLCLPEVEYPGVLPAVGMALWDVLPEYEKKDPPKAFDTLLDHVFGLGIDRARELHREPQHADFPPFQRPMIGTSSFSVTPPGSRVTRVDLMVVVEASYDDLSVLAHPEEWPRLCPLFWEDVTRNGNGWDGQWRAPVLFGTEPLKVRIDDTFRRVNPTETKAEIRMQAESVGRARLLFDMRPEPQKPGWTRITHRREVTFAGDMLRSFRNGSVAYWTKSEIACLVLQ